MIDMEGQTKSKQGARKTDAIESVIKTALRKVDLENSGKQFISKQSKIEGCNITVRYEEGLEDAVKPVREALKQASMLLKSKNDIEVTITNIDNSIVREEMGGSTGYSDGVNHIFILIDTRANNWKDSIKSTTAHEFNHLIRSQKIAGREKVTIRTVLAWDGLAQNFEERVAGSTAPYSKALAKEKATEVWKKIKDKLDTDSDDFYRRLFFRRDYSEFAPWSGYALSYLIIKAKIEALGGKVNWEELMKTPSATLVGDDSLV